MSKGIVDTVIGGAEIAAGAVLIATGVGAPFGAALIVAGAGEVMTGIAEMLEKQPGQGVATTNPVGPYNYIYGTMKVPGVEIFSETNSKTGTSTTSNDKQWHRVFALACHPTDSLVEVRLDGQVVNLVPQASSDPNTTIWQSASPSQTTCNITSISRSGGIVTMKVSGGFAATFNGQTMVVSGVRDNTYNGVWTLWLPNPADLTTWQYQCGGADGSSTGGRCETCLPDYSNKIHIEFQNGSQTKTFPTLLAAQNGSTSPLTWLPTDVCYGHTVVYVQMGFDSAYFPSYPTNMSFVVKGKNDILDPRTGQHGYTENAALCIADYMAQARLRGGFGLAIGSTIDQNNLIAAANTCDESLTLAVGGTVPQYSCNTNFDLNSPRGTNIQRMLSACAGRLSVQGGVWSIIPGAYVAPSLFLNEKNVVGPIKVDTRLSVMEACNAVKGTFVSPANNYQPSDYPLYQQDALHGFATNTWLAEDGNEIIVHNLDLPCTNVSAVAQRLAKIQLMRQRYQYRLHLQCDLTAYQATVGDVVGVSLARYNWVNEPFEVLHVGLAYDDKGKPVVELDLAQVDGASSAANSAIYTWSPTEELSITDSLVPNNVGVRVCSPPENVVAYSGPGAVVNGVTCPSTIATGADGSVANSIYVEWTQPNDANVVHGGHIEVQWQAVGASSWTSAGKVDPSTNYLSITGVSDNTSYNLQVRAVNAAGVPSNWIAAAPAPVTTCAATTSITVGIPTNLALEDDNSTSVVLSDGTSMARLLVTWTPPVDNYVTNGGTIQVQYMLTANGTEPSPLLRPVGGPVQWQSAWVDAGTVSGNATFMYIDGIAAYQIVTVRIRAVRSNGVASAWITTDNSHRIIRPTPILGGGNTIIQYTDGTTIETWKPAESGAEKTTGKSLDILADGNIYKRVAAQHVMTGGVLQYTGGMTLDSLKPAQAGADKTSNNLSAGSAVIDTRSTNPAPSYYRSLGMGVRHEFKACSAIGCPSTSGYVSLETKVPWTDTSGGVLVQEVNAYDGVWVRKGSSDDSAWLAWYKSYDNQNKPGLDGDVLDGTSYKRVSASHVMAGGVLQYTSGGTIDSLKPAQAGADVTGQNTAKDTGAVNGRAASDVSNTVVAGGGIDFASGLHKNKTASNVAYSSGASVESLRPAQAGADVTGSNQSASTATLNGTPASAININGGSFTVGGSGANFYPVQLKSLTPAWANSSNARSNYLELYRDNVHENGSWYGVFTLELGFHPSNWGNWPNNPVEYLFYKPGGGGTANGAAYNWNDPLGDIQDGTAQSGGSDVIIWLRGGATYHWQNVNPASGWQLLNGNSGGTSITNSSGATCNIISAQTAMVMAAKGGQSTPGYTSDHAGISCGGVPIIGSGGKAVDQTGNLKLKNTKSVPWVTANPSVNTSTFADLPELGSGNSAMTIALAGNPVVIGANLNFYGATGSGTSGPVIGIGTTFTQPTAQRTVNQGPPQVYIVITGNGTGAGAGVSWAFTQQGIGPAPAYIPYGYFTPTLSITGGQGYTTASATVTITNGESAYPNGSNPYNCSIGVSTPVSGVPIQARILMDGIPVVGPVQVTTDSKGYASLTFPLTLQFPTQSSHSFQVQAWNLNSTYTVTSTFRQFQLVELG